MMRRIRSLTRFMLAAMVFTIAAYPCLRPELICRREIYHALESDGVISSGPSLWGQIAGRNIPLHPAWMTRVVRGVSTLGTLPALCLAFLLYDRLNRSRSWFLSRRWKHVALSVALAWGAYALVIGTLEPWAAGLLRDAAFRLGRSMGCTYFQSGVVAVGPNGPFIDGKWATACNQVWRLAPRIVVPLVAFIPSILTFHLLSRRHAGPDASRCTRCGYDLTGLRDAMCPECGVTLGAPQI